MSSPGGRKMEKKHRSPIRVTMLLSVGVLSHMKDEDYLIAGNCLLSRMREK